MHFQELISTLQTYWAKQGCAILQSIDTPVGAGTFHTATFLKALDKKPWQVAYVQPCRRPTDGRYGENPNRLQYYYQFQVILKPSPLNIQTLYLDSLKYIGIDPLVHDIRFIEDNWESPTLGAWGLGWEVWQNGMEISQFTYFQQVGGVSCEPVTGELTYGLERIALNLQNVNSIFDLKWNNQITYGELFLPQEKEMSAYHFDYADINKLFDCFNFYEKECEHLLAVNLPLAAYDQVLHVSHLFNILDARKAFSVPERQRYILRIRQLAIKVVKSYQNHYGSVEV